MKILALHCDYLRFKPLKKALKKPEEVKKEAKTEIKECLVILSAVEKRDEQAREEIVKGLVVNIKDIASQVKAKTIVLYPYVHLTSEPATPDTALYILKEAEKELNKTKALKIVRAPFGWYKEFELKCKGHPLAELSREIGAGTCKETKESGALAAEKKLRSEWYIFDGKKLSKLKVLGGKVSGYSFKKKSLQNFANYEIHKTRTEVKEPLHVKIMRKLELVDYESASDPGNFRFYPKGRLIKALLEEITTKRMQDYGALEVETPIMYNSDYPALKSYIQRFPARQYIVQCPSRKNFLRFSACFGHFIMASQATISYRNLPLRLYELTRYSFRVEQRGELSGLRRLRTFTMPDCHALCADMEQAKKELLLRLHIALDLLKKIGLNKADYEMGLRVTKDFYNKNKKFLERIVKEFGKPVLLEIWPEQFFYFILKYDLNFVDSIGKAAALTTDQIDIENAKNYNITFIDKDNKRKHPIILHLSPPGAIERVIYALLEKAAMQKIPSLPFWLSPTQVRVIPVSQKFIKQAEHMAEDLNNHQHARADLDDRPLHVEKKIYESQQEWIPYTVVLGERELKSGTLAVRFRDGKVKTIKPKEFIKLLEKEQNKMLFRPLPLPMLLSKRPKFV